MEHKILSELQRILDKSREYLEAGENDSADWWFDYFCAVRGFAERITGNRYNVWHWKVVVNE